MRSQVLAFSFLSAVLLLYGCAAVSANPQAAKSTLPAISVVTGASPNPAAPDTPIANPVVTATPVGTDTPLATATPGATETIPTTQTPAPSATPTPDPIQLEGLPFIGLSNIERLGRLARIDRPGSENGLPTNFSFSPDSHLLALGAGRDVQIRDIRQGTASQVLSPPSQVSTPGGAMSFSRDGQTLARIYGLNRIEVWSIKTGQAIRELAGSSPDEVFAMLAFGRSGTDASRLVTSGIANGEPRLTFWNVITGEVLAESNSSAQQVDGFQISPNDRLVLQAGHDGILRFWNLETGKPIGQQILYACPDSLVSTVFSQDSQLFAVQCDGGENTQAKSRIFLYWPNYFRPDNLILASILYSEQLGSGQMAFNRYDELLVLVDGAQGNQVTFWGISSRAVVKSLSFAQSIRQLAFSPDGRLLAVQFADGSVELWGIS